MIILLLSLSMGGEAKIMKEQQTMRWWKYMEVSEVSMEVKKRKEKSSSAQWMTGWGVLVLDILLHSADTYWNI